MIVPAYLAQDRLARDQYTNTFPSNHMGPSTIYAHVPTIQVLVARFECGSLAHYFHLLITFSLEILLPTQVFLSQ